MWTQFWDMHSGGGQKEDYGMIYIEAPKEEAKLIFYNRFGHNPERVTCTCCGEDYSIHEWESLEQATAYHRYCKYDDSMDMYVEEPDGRNTWGKYMTLEEYLKSGEGLAIYEKDIKPGERDGLLPEQGYVWID